MGIQEGEGGGGRRSLRAPFHHLRGKRSRNPLPKMGKESGQKLKKGIRGGQRDKRDKLDEDLGKRIHGAILHDGYVLRGGGGRIKEWLNPTLEIGQLRTVKIRGKTSGMCCTRDGSRRRGGA